MKLIIKKDEIKKAQKTISFFNKINIIFIIIHTFFYNSLTTCIYPLLFLYIKYKNNKIDKHKHIYSFLVIVFTYLISFVFMIIYQHIKIKNIKTTNNISYILLFIGSLSYGFSIIYLEKINNNLMIFSLILGSRIFIGFGDNIMMCKKYITLYSPRFYVAKFSLYFIIFQILGLATGPLIGSLLFNIEDSSIWKFQFNCYNCIGWYGCIFSLILFVFNCLIFTRPDSTDFFILRNESIDNNANKNYYDEDIEDTQDKEFYKIQKEMINNKQSDLNNSIENNISGFINKDDKEENDEIKKFSIEKRYSNIKSQKNLTIFNEIGKTKKVKKRTSSLSKNDLDEITIENDEENIITTNNNNYNPLLVQIQKEMEENENIEGYTDNDFNSINMIPRAIDDIIRKEQMSFGYINHNLLFLFLLLFFNNIFKENFIPFSSYYITEKDFLKDNNKYNINLVILFCFLTGITYLSELFSLFFIFPFHKINYLFKPILIILMTFTYIIMISLSIIIKFNIKLPCYIIISLLILINIIIEIIEIISSSYLSYLLPPDWHFSNIKAGALTVYIMNIGKIVGCLFCLVSYSDIDWYCHGITCIMFLAYFFLSIYLYKSTNIRIKSICRIIQQKKLNEFIL